ncbi:16S rRNA (adenine(1518)-N(6)/adenine(1519)-N(6))-dimethyltransferase RsmA [Desulfatirhabdium butyrativorans]|uniref:16S rRNA (adenine(1518)-N(6)/adenine(1519)-N(6))- dimethyltransferase RsmA n=1 Tax=Desulfatirhabdium butyrativorans TaxID=340467 RepID=UPI0003FA6F50|nr:16S rRNA (adenine(1518)-N(6)/adenine(1519)-N(6))-dimethyltransferase RsmA [Desulfatirhabdium butyrativorans]
MMAPNACMVSPQAWFRSKGLHARKSLGQNFLQDAAVAQAIVDRSGVGAEDIVLEIGPGLGALSFPIARRVKRLVVVEKDPELAAWLTTEIAEKNFQNITLHAADILQLDWMAIFDEMLRDAEGYRLVIFGNLPYNISSQIVVRLVEHRHRIERAVLMFQKELAERLRAEPGGRDYGRLTVLLRFCAHITTLVNVGARSFYPKPKVDSEVIEIRFPKPEPFPVPDEAALIRVVRAAFGNRRKTLKNSLMAGLPGVRTEDIAHILRTIGIDPVRRAETLDIEDFIRLSLAISAREIMTTER